jgi:hypothetical protein
MKMVQIYIHIQIPNAPKIATFTQVWATTFSKLMWRVETRIRRRELRNPLGMEWKLAFKFKGIRVYMFIL